MFWQVFYSVSVNGNEVHNVENNDPRTFQDVRVFASADARSAAKAKYRNLIWWTGGCQADWSEFNGKCYKIFTELKNWEDAQNECVQEKVIRSTCKDYVP